MSEKPEKIEAADAGDQNVDKIREILFGEQIRAYDSRFSTLEQRLVAENEKMGQFLEKRLTGIATATQRELAGLAEQIDAQRKKLESLQSDSRSELESTKHQIDERYRNLEDMFDKEARALRNDLGEQHNALVDLVKSTRAGMEEILGRETQNLQRAKVGRADLSALLAELAARLKQEGEGE